MSKPDRQASSAAGHRFPLSEAVEALSDAGYVVLGPENAEETATLLGALAYEDEVENASWRATQALAAFPEGFGRAE